MPIIATQKYNFGKLNPLIDSLPEEAQLQIICVKYLAENYPEIICFHFPNTSAGTQIVAKLMGLKAGFPDMMLIDLYANIYFLEFKSEYGKVSEAQQKMHESLQSIGYEVPIIRSFEEWKRFLYKTFGEK